MMNRKDRILSFADSGCSIKFISRSTGMSEQTIRHILVANGRWSNKTSEKVLKLHEAGFSANEICEKLNISRNTVLGYIPYQRGIVDPENPTKNAIRIRRFRLKTKTIK